jgi:hypothetical protein
VVLADANCQSPQILHSREDKLINVDVLVNPTKPGSKTARMRGNAKDVVCDSFVKCAYAQV